MPPIELSDKTVLITGASSGIGLACAHAFARHDARLIIAARRKERIDALAQELHRNHDTDVLTIQLDVRNQPAVEKAIRELPDQWKDIDVLVNNAGLSRGLDKLHE